MLRLSKYERKGPPACFDGAQHDTPFFASSSTHRLYSPIKSLILPNNRM
jgi:hypothetical protein